MKKSLSGGFTLIELLVVCAILGLLVAIAIPRFTRIIAKSQEGAVKGQLGSLRSALSIYYGDMQGTYPAGNLAAHLIPKFLDDMPDAKLPAHANNVGHIGPNTASFDGIIPTSLTDMVGGMGWLYDNNAGTPEWGRVIVNCSHQDVRGDNWTSF